MHRHADAGRDANEQHHAIAADGQTFRKNSRQEQNGRAQEQQHWERAQHLRSRPVLADQADERDAATMAQIASNTPTPNIGTPPSVRYSE